MPTRPIFIFSLPRAGSTLLQRMLSTHEDINTKSELWFLLPHVEALKSRYTFSWYSNLSLENATRSLLEQLPHGEDDYYRAIRALGDSLYESLARNGERYVLDKTPRYYLIINDIVKIYPDAKFIFLFRNPLSVAASIVESFNRGRLGDFRHKIDLYLGSRLLAEGYESIKDHSIVVHYEKLVVEPQHVLEKVCTYLDIPFHSGLVSSFAETPVGVFGDQFGSAKFTALEPGRMENWRRVFSTTFRQRYLLKYLRDIGRGPIETFGYDFDDLQAQVANMEVQFSTGMRDRYNLLKCEIMSLFEGIVFREKILRHGKLSSKTYMLH